MIIFHRLREALSVLAVAMLVLGAPGMAGTAQAETITAEDGSTIERFGSWAGRCNTGPEGQEVCHVFVDVRSSETEQRALYFGIGKQPGQGYFGLIIVPLGTHLGRGIDMKIDGHEPFNAQMQVCLPGGCQSTTGFDAARIQQLKGGNDLIVGISDIGQGPVELKLSLSGITAAINWLDTKHAN